MERQFALRAELSKFFEPRAIRRCIELGGGDDHRLFAELFTERQKLVVDDFKRVNRIRIGKIAGVKQVDEQACTFDVAQKTDAEARAFVRAFNQAWQVRDDKRAAQYPSFAARAAVGTHNAQIWFESGEGIVRDFRPRGGNDGNQRRFSSVGKTDEANVREEFQLEAQMALFAGLTFFVLARSLVPRLGEMLIAASAASTVRD